MYKYGFTGSPEVAISQKFGDITFVGVAIVQYSSCLLNIYILLQAPPTPSVRDILYGFFQLAPDNNVALDISFGTVGCALPLAMAFRSVCYNVLHFLHTLLTPPIRSWQLASMHFKGILHSERCKPISAPSGFQLMHSHRMLK